MGSFHDLEAGVSLPGRKKRVPDAHAKYSEALVREEPRTIFLVRNGDLSNKLHTLLLQPRNAVTLSQVLERATRVLQEASPCKKLFTRTGKLVTDVDKIENGETYVAVTWARFRNIGYTAMARPEALKGSSPIKQEGGLRLDALKRKPNRKPKQAVVAVQRQAIEVSEEDDIKEETTEEDEDEGDAESEPDEAPGPPPLLLEPSPPLSPPPAKPPKPKQKRDSTGSRKVPQSSNLSSGKVSPSHPFAGDVMSRFKEKEIESKTAPMQYSAGALTVSSMAELDSIVSRLASDYPGCSSWIMNELGLGDDGKIWKWPEAIAAVARVVPLLGDDLAVLERVAKYIAATSPDCTAEVLLPLIVNTIYFLELSEWYCEAVSVPAVYDINLDITAFSDSQCSITVPDACTLLLPFSTFLHCESPCYRYTPLPLLLSLSLIF